MTMEKDIKLIVTDIDGTLLGDDWKVPQMNIDAIQAAKNMGVKVCACTARNWPQSVDILQQAGLVDYCMLCNGVVILDASNQEIQYRNRIAPVHVEPLMKIAMEFGAWIGVTGTFHSYNWPGAMRGEWRHHAEEEGKPVPTFVKRMRESMVLADTYEEWVENCKNDCNYISVGVGYDQHVPLYAAISEIGNFELSAADDDHVYIMAKDATKGLAVEILANLYGFAQENVLAFGDNKNDASMLSWAGIGVAMGNGNEQAKSAADYVTVSNTEGGVGREIMRLVVNKRR
ncbi:Cof-type HAD-IIB family hydrolase [Eubacteriales bacterium OttesenSCG-928-M02]|nr:Cof-type HAD-IIB family hydrolase [Eubacteriales bacterium OttesenSCG-928-M02]